MKLHKMNIIEIQKELYKNMQTETMLTHKLQSKTMELQAKIEKLDNSKESFFEVKTDAVFNDCFVVKLHDINIDIEKLISTFKDDYLIKLDVYTQKELDDNEYTYARLMFYERGDKNE